MRKLFYILLAACVLCMASCAKEKQDTHNYLTIGSESHPLDMAGTLIAINPDGTYHFDGNDTCEHFHIFGEFAPQLVGNSVSLTGQDCHTPYWLGINSNSSSFAIYTGWWDEDYMRTDFSSGDFRVSKKDGKMIVHAEGVLATGEQVVVDIAVPENEVNRWE